MLRVRLSLESLDQRVMPARYRWSPQAGNGINWGQPTNWEMYSIDDQTWARNAANGSAPGATDEADFTGAAANPDDCRVSGAVTVKLVVIESTYIKTLILSSPLTIDNANKEVGGLLRFESWQATIAGYMASRGMPANQGALIIEGGSTFAWKDGNLRDVDVTLQRSVQGNETWVGTGRVFDGYSSTHYMTSSSIQVNGVLDWESGNVVVTTTTLPSTVWVANSGVFNLTASGTWGGLSFVVHNAGQTRVNTSDTARIQGDYRTTALTVVEHGGFSITDEAIQSGSSGMFDLHTGSVVANENLDIMGGMMIGDGTVAGDLYLGGTVDTATIMPGRLTYSEDEGGAPIVVYTRGTINVTGDFAMFNNACVWIKSTPTNYGRLVIADDAQLSGTFIFDRNSQFRPEDPFTPISYGVNGSGSDFDRVILHDVGWTNSAGWFRFLYTAGPGATGYTIYVWHEEDWVNGDP